MTMYIKMLVVAKLRLIKKNETPFTTPQTSSKLVIEQILMIWKLKNWPFLTYAFPPDDRNLTFQKDGTHENFRLAFRKFPDVLTWLRNSQYQSALVIHWRSLVWKLVIGEYFLKIGFTNMEIYLSLISSTIKKDQLPKISGFFADSRTFPQKFPVSNANRANHFWKVSSAFNSFPPLPFHWLSAWIILHFTFVSHFALHHHNITSMCCKFPRKKNYRQIQIRALRFKQIDQK